MKLLHTISRGVEKTIEYLIGLLCLLLLACLFIEVFNRYVFAISWPFLQFLIPFCFVWLCMLGAVLAVRRKQHFVVDLLSNVLPARAKTIHSFVIVLSVFSAGAVIFYSSISFAELGLFKKNSATGLPMVYIYSSLMTGGFLIMLMSLDDLVSFWNPDPKRKNLEQTTEEEVL